MVNEKRLIDANALMGDIEEELAYDSPMYTAEQNKWIDTGLRIAAHNIRRQATVDAVEVVHGRWIPKLESVWNLECPVLCGCTCSVCNTTWDAETIYCPNCGAKMDGDGNG